MLDPSQMLQQSCQLELDILSCPETERVAREEEQRKLDEVAEHTTKTMERLQQHIDNFFDISKHQDPALHTIELEYHLNAYNYPEDRWMQALVTTLVGDGRLWAISTLQDQPWNVAQDLFHRHYCLPDIKATTIEAVALFQQKPGESIHQLIDRYSVLCNRLSDTFYDYLKAFFFGRALLPHIKSKSSKQSFPNLLRKITTANHLKGNHSYSTLWVLFAHTAKHITTRQSSPSSHSLNSMSSTQQQSNTPAPATEQQDSIGDEEEYDEFCESQQALNSITVTDNMPGPNDPICAPMTINSHRVTNGTRDVVATLEIHFCYPFSILEYTSCLITNSFILEVEFNLHAWIVKHREGRKKEGVLGRRQGKRDKKGCTNEKKP
ncbi:hypothetical protein QOT17_008184 [Balamuthia mandrillaris]